jgi:hypothetical protein
MFPLTIDNIISMYKLPKLNEIRKTQPMVQSKEKYDIRSEKYIL